MNIANLFRVAASFSWLVLIGLLVLAAMRTARKQPARGLATGMVIALVVAILATTMGAGLVFIEPYEVGVVVTILSSQGGMRAEPLSSGLHWIVPFVERVERYPISIQTFTLARTESEGETMGQLTVEARTSDGQRIWVDSSVIYQINPTVVTTIHREWQHRYQDDLILPQTRGIIRDAVSQYRVEEVFSSRRFDMANKITEDLQKVLVENGLILVDFVLRDITFTEEYAQSIELKQIAEQQALQAKFVVEQRKQEAEQARQVAQGQADAAVIAAKGAAQARIIEAEADAKANELIALSLAGRPELLTWLYITKLAPSIQVMLLPNNAPFLFPLPDIITQ